MGRGVTRCETYMRVCPLLLLWRLQVYVSVYADGPTRVLCFSEERITQSAVHDQNSLINLAYRWVVGGRAL